MWHKLHRFLLSDIGPGLILFVVLCIALMVANSDIYLFYDDLLDIPVQIRFGTFNISKPLLIWINEGLMAVFFMSISMEMKREILSGALSHWRQFGLPVFAAIGGVTLPAIIYLLCTRFQAGTVKGWPIPTTTDIAFSLAALSLVGRRAPVSIRTFLIALSIVDDIIAVCLIAVVYHANLSFFAMCLSVLGVGVLAALNYFRVRHIPIYLMVGIFLWTCMVKSGIHATVAGVIVGLFIPMFPEHNPSYSPLIKLERDLRPYISYFILPVFVFWNGGITFQNFQFSDMLQNVPLGIILGLWLGKLLGIFFTAMLLIKCKIVPPLKNATSWHILGISAFAGIGFTMSLFLGSLAFNLTQYEDITGQSVLIGSLLSLITGSIIFAWKGMDRPHAQ